MCRQFVPDVPKIAFPMCRQIVPDVPKSVPDVPKFAGKHSLDMISY
jgi:hypothetical protein